MLCRPLLTVLGYNYTQDYEVKFFFLALTEAHEVIYSILVSAPVPLGLRYLTY